MTRDSDSGIFLHVTQWISLYFHSYQWVVGFFFFWVLISFNTKASWLIYATEIFFPKISDFLWYCSIAYSIVVYFKLLFRPSLYQKVLIPFHQNCLSTSSHFSLFILKSCIFLVKVGVWVWWNMHLVSWICLDILWSGRAIVSSMWQKPWRVQIHLVQLRQLSGRVEYFSFWCLDIRILSVASFYFNFQTFMIVLNLW